MPKREIPDSVVDQKDVFDSAYDAVKIQINVKKFKTTDLVKFAVLAMQVAEKYPKLTGDEKKDLVIRLATRLVAELPKLSDEEKAALNLAIELTLPAAIDHIVYASKGQLSLNEAAPVSGGFWSRLFCCGTTTSTPTKK